MNFNVDSVACLPQCTEQTLPLLDECSEFGIKGRLVDLYAIPCDDWDNDTIAADIIDIAWWNTLLTTPNPKLRRIGKITGSVAPSEQTKVDFGGSYGDELTEIEYEFTFIKNKFDTSVDFKTHQFITDLMNGAVYKYNFIGRYRNPVDTILAIGRARIESVNDVTPAGIKEYQSVEVKLRWTYPILSTQQRITVAGLNDVLPI